MDEATLFLYTIYCFMPLMLLSYTKLLFSVRIKNDDQETTYRQRLRLFYKHSHLGFSFETVNAILSILSSCLYITETYEIRSFITLVFSTVSDCFFSSHFVFLMFIHRFPAKYPLTTQGMVDLVTLIPTYVAWGDGDFYGNTVGFFRTYRLIKILRVFKVARVLRSARLTRDLMDPVNFKIFDSLLHLICSLVIIAGIIQAFERKVSGDIWESDDDFTFLDSLYFTVVTISTVGYGDVSPPGAGGRLLVVIFISLVIFWIPKATARVISLRQLKPKYMRSIKVSSNFVIICGDPEGGKQIRSLVNNLFHPDTGLDSPHAGILVPWVHSPDDTFNSLLLAYGEENVQFLRGDLQGRGQHEKAKISKAKAVFIISTHGTDQKKLDGRAVLRVLTCQQVAPDVKVFVQVIQRKTKEALLGFGIPESNIVCREETQFMQITSGILCHGWATVISNLLTFEGSVASKYNVQADYLEGVGKEIYSFRRLGEGFHNCSFADAALNIHEAHGLILVAIYRKREGEVYVAPPSPFTIEPEDSGLLICDDREALLNISPTEILRATMQKAGREVRRLSNIVQSNRSSTCVSNYSSTTDINGEKNEDQCSPLHHSNEELKPYLEDGNSLILITRYLSGGLAHMIDDICLRYHHGLTNISEVYIICRSVEVGEEDYLQQLSDWSPVADNVKVHMYVTDPTPSLLKKIGLEKTTVIAFLTDPTAQDFYTADMEAVVTLLDMIPHLQKFNGRIMIELHTPDLIDQVSLLQNIIQTVELRSPENSKDLLDYSGAKVRDAIHKLSKHVLLRELINVDMLDAMQMQSSTRPDKITTEAFASGDVIINDVPELLLCHAYLQKELGRMIRVMHDDHSKKNLSTVVQVHIPNGFWDGCQEPTFKNLFAHFLQTHEALLVGIYRHSKETPAVVTAPHSDFQLQRLDTAYILVSKMKVFHHPKPTEKSPSLEDKRNMLLNYSKSRQRMKDMKIQSLPNLDNSVEHSQLEQKLDFVVQKLESIEDRLSNLEMYPNSTEGIQADCSKWFLSNS